MSEDDDAPSPGHYDHLEFIGPMSSDRADRLAAALAASGPSRILDLGCGAGPTTVAMAGCGAIATSSDSPI